jgi:hypothetical protein
MVLAKKLATTPRRLLLALTTVFACAYTVLAPTAAPSLGSIECAAPPYDAAVTMAMADEQDIGKNLNMSTLRLQAGQALAQLQTKTAANQ